MNFHGKVIISNYLSLAQKARSVCLVFVEMQDFSLWIDCCDLLPVLNKPSYVLRNSEFHRTGVQDLYGKLRTSEILPLSCEFELLREGSSSNLFSFFSFLIQSALRITCIERCLTSLPSYIVHALCWLIRQGTHLINYWSSDLHKAVCWAQASVDHHNPRGQKRSTSIPEGENIIGLWKNQ